MGAVAYVRWAEVTVKLKTDARGEDPQSIERDATLIALNGWVWDPTRVKVQYSKKKEQGGV